MYLVHLWNINEQEFLHKFHKYFVFVFCAILQNVNRQYVCFPIFNFSSSCSKCALGQYLCICKFCIWSTVFLTFFSLKILFIRFEIFMYFINAIKTKSDKSVSNFTDHLFQKAKLQWRTLLIQKPVSTYSPNIVITKIAPH